MTFEHKELAAGRWKKMPLAEQMANIGSEISRALNWMKKGKKEFSGRAVSRALELIDLSLDSGGAFPRLRELARLREAVADYFLGENLFRSSPELWRKYFDHFAFLARK